MTVRTIAEAKAHAKSLRNALASDGTVLGHAQALEIVARQNGARDWNTLSARLVKAAPSPFHLHQRVQGRYLGQPFKGEINAISSSGPHYSVSVRFDEPVDTVIFDSFSNMRRVARGVVDIHGMSVRKTSNGTPHLMLSAL
ncbi:glyoxalase superfamily protein [Pararhizobium antarcticum]|uniref:Glyoxalase-related protein domain-containing protein n=1 Tax=Pararhizobium antarcticum TaxID=1798805 RepID=A0A657LV40_9HYPH|nr:glyoxalase superfamily protein [Pararhizobium antarcticum]OJF97241.1 hypothetical protein AX761_15120 [Rhizobium sp. 58]OJF99088.1 hypothetical protein AX760_14025 [Pararhizobium antarcticum]